MCDTKKGNSTDVPIGASEIEWKLRHMSIGCISTLRSKCMSVKCVYIFPFKQNCNHCCYIITESVFSNYTKREDKYFS